MHFGVAPTLIMAVLVLGIGTDAALLLVHLYWRWLTVDPDENRVQIVGSQRLTKSFKIILNHPEDVLLKTRVIWERLVFFIRPCRYNAKNLLSLLNTSDFSVEDLTQWHRWIKNNDGQVYFSRCNCVTVNNTCATQVTCVACNARYSKYCDMLFY